MGAIVDRFVKSLPSLLDPPVPLASAWVAWLAIGLVLAFWYYWSRRVALDAQVTLSSVSRPVAKLKTAVRPAVKPVSRPDAFGDLQTLLDGSEPYITHPNGD